MIWSIRLIEFGYKGGGISLKKRICGLILVLSMMLVLMAGCSDGNVEAKPNEEEIQPTYIPVEVGEVTSKTLANKTSVNGKVLADKEIMILPTIPGKVKSVAVEDGDWVSKGDILFTLDDKNIRNQVNQARVGYEMAKANYNMTQDQISTAKDLFEQTEALTENLLENARENLENTEILYEAGAVSESQLDQARLAFEQQEIQLQSQLDQAEMGSSDQIVEVAKSQLEQAQLAYNQAEDALNDAMVTSPTDGVVTGVSIQAGGMASNAQPAMSVVGMNRVYVNINVVEGLINQISKGQEVVVTIPAITSEPIYAVIDSVVPVPDMRTQLYPIKIYLDNDDGSVKPGMFANVEIALDAREDVLSVPSDAILVKDGVNLVYIVEDGKAVERQVELGLDTGRETEIVSGLKENETVIIKGQNYVEDGGDIKVVGGTE